LLTDLNKDGKVNILDLFIVAMAFNTRPGDARWNVVADVNNDGVVDITDVWTIARDFGKTP
jgi:endoglucanase